ncbi:response regulator transcription factor [Deinococcus sedimenti]|uniref:DNA-binding response regulator n=1 Tax=Deinococcus sedimenti TaxID=1867090 RepID=A0ABQ2S433_9DEIO|nr:response regulator transcription factor [Deinococcus sedimenti]GGR94581.1 DNA-binding response regulator [Deinococcus sedimenti]
MRVLVVEDDLEIARAVCAYLHRDGHVPVHAGTAPAARDAVAREQPDLILLDVMLPGGSGLDVLTDLRRERRTPVLILSALGDEATLVQAFQSGADDYVVKPFRPLELLARVNAVARRAGLDRTLLSGPGGVTVNLRSRQVTRGGAPLDLTAMEFELYARLLAEAGEAVSRERLVTALGLNGERTIDSHVKNLRRKLGDQHGIDTVFGVGYRLGVPADR